MAKVVENTSEPSQSSTSLPPLADNEVELVIERFWRDTRPRVCVRSETKNVNGFNFRLLVWPQGSKQSQSHLSAFVEVVPPSQLAPDSPAVQDAGPATVYPPDWACPCVFYRISVMNFKQKYPYSKADTWTFSYVCPDRGWHTLLDTRYINRRDGYLSNDGALVIRAIAFPRFAHPVSVLPLLGSISHTNPVVVSSSLSSTSPRRLIGLSNILATDHLNSLIQTLFHLPGFRRYIYSLHRKGTVVSAGSSSIDPSVDTEAISSGIDSCIETVQEVMDRITAASPEISRLIQSEFYNECRKSQNQLCTCGGPSSSLNPLKIRYGRCRALIRCIEETLLSVSASLNRRTPVAAAATHSFGNKRIQVDAYCQIIRDCGRILSSVASGLFTTTSSSSWNHSNLVEELQLIFAKMEYSQDHELVSRNSLIDTRGLVRELGLSNGGLSSRVTPDGLFVVFFEALRKCVAAEMTNSDSYQLDELISGSISDPTSSTDADIQEDFTHIRLNPSNKSLTSLDKYIANWMGRNNGSGGEDEVVVSAKFSQIPKILNVQFLNKAKDRLDAPERLCLASYMSSSSTTTRSTPVEEEETAEDVCGKKWKNWSEFLSHTCLDNETISPQQPTSGTSCTAYRLHSIMLCSGEVATGHYSVLVRSNRLCGWTRYDDAWKEEFVDAYDLSFSSSGGPQSGNAVSSNPHPSNAPPPSSPDWVFSPEWSCSSLCYVREDAVSEMYNRGCDVRLVRPEIFSVACQEIETDLLGSAIACNRYCLEEVGSGNNGSSDNTSSTPSTPSSTLDTSCQVEVMLITEKDVLGACPGGFSVPFAFSVPNVSRKLIVRKDIAVDRLMKAVNEHFKIPLEMQRLLALRYYPETQQERFELMNPTRSIASYLAPSSFDLTNGSGGASNSKNGGSGNRKIAGGGGGGNGLYPNNMCSNLYVLVSAIRGTNLRTVFVKYYDEKLMGIVSVGILHLDPNASLKDHFEQVAGKTNLGGSLVTAATTPPFIVFEEVSARSVELKRTTVAIKDERIVDGDILIFVPLTDNAKKALIGTSLGGCSTDRLRSKRRLLASSSHMVENGIKTHKHSLLTAQPMSGDCNCEECFEDNQDVVDCNRKICDHDEASLDERCRRFLERTKNDPNLIDDAYEEMILNELMMDEIAHEVDDDDDDEDEDVLSSDLSDEDDDNDDETSRVRFETIRRLMKKEPSARVADLMSDIMKELVVDTGGGESELGATGKKPTVGMMKCSATRRLEIPSELREEISRISAPVCFYCQLPLASASTLAEQSVSKIACCRVTCTARCVNHTMLYHDRCVRDLIREMDLTNPLGADACIITENCPGRIILDSASIKRLEAAAAAAAAGSLRGGQSKLGMLSANHFSASALRSKLGSVLGSHPEIPEMQKSGIVKPVVDWKWSSSVPPIPSTIKMTKKNVVDKKTMKMSLPTESLWWNACVVAFGMENLQSAILDKHWDAGELEKARALFNQWCRVLLERHHPWRPKHKSATTTSGTVREMVVRTITTGSEDESSDSDSSSSSSEEEEEEPEEVRRMVVEQVETIDQLVVEESKLENEDDDDDDDFVLVSSKGPRRTKQQQSQHQPHTNVGPRQYAPSLKGQSTDSTDVSAQTTPSGVVSIPEGLCGPIAIELKEEVVNLVVAKSESEKVVDPLPLKSSSILDEIDYLLVDDDAADQDNNIMVSATTTPVTIDSVLESRMNLLPAFVRPYCLPIELVFVYYSEEFFVSRMIDVSNAKTLALVPPTIDEETFLNLITMSAFNNNCAISRVFVSPVEDASSLVHITKVQWFVEFSTVMDCHKFASWVASNQPQWMLPEIGALLPASMLGFAV